MASVVSRAITQYVPAVIEAATGTGKALDVDTPIPTPTGWKRMGDLVTGDFVFDEKGHPTRVIAAFDAMHGHKCYEVIFSDGSSLIADAEHEWISYTCADREYTLVTTEQMAATLTIGSSARANHAIVVAGALTLPEADLPIDPYFLGVWLGDSTFASIHPTADPINRAPTSSPDKSGGMSSALAPENVGTRFSASVARSRALIPKNKHIPTVHLP